VVGVSGVQLATMVVVVVVVAQTLQLVMLVELAPRVVMVVPEDVVAVVRVLMMVMTVVVVVVRVAMDRLAKRLLAAMVVWVLQIVSLAPLLIMPAEAGAVTITIDVLVGPEGLAVTVVVVMVQTVLVQQI
jgi:hypothetical protein